MNKDLQDDITPYMVTETDPMAGQIEPDYDRTPIMETDKDISSILHDIDTWLKTLQSKQYLNNLCIGFDEELKAITQRIKAINDHVEKPF
jgi:hypothetical protein